VRLSLTLKSASFKLTAAYAMLFAVSVGMLATVTYLSVTGELSREFHGRILAEVDALKADYRAGSARQVLRAITDRQRGRLMDGLDYTLIDSQGRHLFGSLPAQPCKAGWITLIGPPDGDEAPGQMERLRVFVQPLPHGLCLMVGDDWGEIQDFGSLILRNFGWVFLLSLTLAVGGGFLLSSKFLKRIETINRTAEAIIGGDINRRVPRRSAPDDLDRLAATLNRMLDRTCELTDRIRHQSNDIAHDLRTPLGRLRRLMEPEGKAGWTSRQYERLLEQGTAEVDSILELFDAILRISQIESGSRRGGFQRFCISQLVADICETFAPSLEEGGKTIVQHVEPGLFILGDPELLTVSLANLLENTAVHTPAGSVVTVSLCSDGDCVALAVADDGPGVPQEDRIHIFQRFFRLESSRSTAGNGLGLSMVAAVADLHAARLSTADNGPGLKIDMVFARAS